MISKKIIKPIFLTCLFVLSCCCWSQRTEIDFNHGWRFIKGQPEQNVTGLDFDDSGWEKVNLPHDWAISGPFNPDENGYAGKLPWKGVGWYRKVFVLNKTDDEHRVYIDFDGVMAFPKVYINGQPAGQWDYGYTPFRIDATDFVKFGQQNIIAVQADTRKHGTRWYPGAGIYRKVNMTICSPVHIANWGSFITTDQVNENSAVIQVQTTVENHLAQTSDIDIDVELTDPEGKAAAQGKSSGQVQKGSSTIITQSFKIDDPQLWDIDNPRLYHAKTTVIYKNRLTDSCNTEFGIRTFKFAADDGFHLNGRRVQLYGVNLHHDQGPLGAAFYTRAMERQLEIMKEMGCNALRTSHNPPAKEVLELCDRMGIVVWDECFDKWDGTADRIGNNPPMKEHGRRHLTNLVLRDRNHPSVVVWSIGNEIADVESNRIGNAPELVKYLRDVVLEHDPTRPVGQGCYIPSAVNNHVLDSLDLTGWNYARRYAPARKLFPDKPIVYSESASALSTRGFYDLPLPNTKTDYSQAKQVDSYDHNAAAWSDIPEKEFELMKIDSFVAGEFVWTGFDYIGEPTPFAQEAKSSYFGIVDLCGIPKDRYFLYRSYWRPDTTTIHILPHWNWPDRQGQNVPVYVYTNGDSAELFLNGKSLGRRTKGIIPERPENLALNKRVSTSSSESGKGNIAANALDGKQDTRWCASGPETDQWFQVDLGSEKSIGYLGIDFEREAKYYGYRILVSEDESKWDTIASKNTSQTPRWGGPTQQFHDVKARARYIRIEFNNLADRTWASIKEFGVFEHKVESEYYLPTYKYRLRWNDVIYQPGELKAVAYKGNEKIGQAVMRTAGKTKAIRMKTDRSLLHATGRDLAYILVEAVDDRETPCPLADNMINFEIDGPAEIAGVGNGNPLSLEPFQADFRKLFNGKAMLILRSLNKKKGTIKVTAESEGLYSSSITIKAE